MVYRSIPDFGVFLYVLQDLPAHMQVEGTLGGAVEQVGGLGHLGPQGVEEHLRLLRVPVVALGQRAVPLPQGVEEQVGADGLVQVSVEHLSACCQYVVNVLSACCQCVVSQNVICSHLLPQPFTDKYIYIHNTAIP